MNNTHSPRIPTDEEVRALIAQVDADLRDAGYDPEAAEIADEQAMRRLRGNV